MPDLTAADVARLIGVPPDKLRRRAGG